MDEKQWLRVAIRAILEQKYLSNERYTEMIMQVIESYEAMKEI